MKTIRWFAALVVALVAGVALAQVVSSPSSQAASIGIDWTQIILRVLMGLGAIIGTVLTTVLLPAAKRWAEAKAAEQGASATTKILVGATLKLDGFVEAGVAQCWSVFERDMADAAKPDSDGGSTVTPAELAKAKDDVLAAVKSYLGTAGMAQLSGVLGIGGELLNSYLRAQIDKKVQAAQAAGSVAAAGVTTGQAAAAALSSI